MMSEPLLRVTDLDFAYGRLQVLFGVSIHVDRGEAVALLGTNGAGKSTLLRAVSGLEAPTAGHVFLDGEEITGVPAEKPAAPGLVTVLLVEQSLNIAAQLCERAVFLEKGQVRFEGRTADLLERDDIARAVFLGSAP